MATWTPQQVQLARDMLICLMCSRMDYISDSLFDVWEATVLSFMCANLKNNMLFGPRQYPVIERRDAMRGFQAIFQALINSPELMGAIGLVGLSRDVHVNL